MLKDDNKVRKNKKGKTIVCPYCKYKNNFQELVETERIIKMAGVSIVTCINCEEEFQN